MTMIHIATASLSGTNTSTLDRFVITKEVIANRQHIVHRSQFNDKLTSAVCSVVQFAVVLKGISEIKPISLYTWSPPLYS